MPRKPLRPESGIVVRRRFVADPSSALGERERWVVRAGAGHGADGRRATRCVARSVDQISINAEGGSRACARSRRSPRTTEAAFAS